MKTKATKTLAGHICVDAGLCWVGDPCYVMGEESSYGVDSWGEFCDKHFANDSAADVTEPLGQGIGFAISTGYGDGAYPVYVTKENGRVKKIEIKFF